MNLQENQTIQTIQNKCNPLPRRRIQPNSQPNLINSSPARSRNDVYNFLTETAPCRRNVRNVKTRFTRAPARKYIACYKSTLCSLPQNRLRPRQHDKRDAKRGCAALNNGAKYSRRRCGYSCWGSWLRRYGHCASYKDWNTDFARREREWKKGQIG